MKTVLLIGVNYRSYDALRCFLESVNVAAAAIRQTIAVDVAIADNTEPAERQTLIGTYENIRQITICPSERNAGYLGGALPVYNRSAHAYDWVSISNVDLQLQPTFFTELLNIHDEQLAWIAPDIYTAKIFRHENPYMLRRPTRRNFLLWNIIYSSTMLYRLYRLLYKFKSKHHTASEQSCRIYAAHGSFMLFTREFVRRYPTLQFPSYMYGEEIWLAELIRLADMHVLYAPALKIQNTGNINTSQLQLSRKLNWSKTSLRIIAKQFFNN